MQNNNSNGWRKVFYILFAAALVPCIGAYWAIPSTRPDPNADKRIDFLGAALVTGGLVILLYAMTAGSTAPQGFKTSCKPDVIQIIEAQLIRIVLFRYHCHAGHFRLPVRRVHLLAMVH